MVKERNVINYYVLCNKLKDVLRTGWLNWNVKRDRIESVAEHIYSVQMLAIAMHSEFEYDVDIMKIIKMISVHELEEIIIGDIPMFSSLHTNKAIKGHAAVKEILKDLMRKDEIESLIKEFDERKTPEALFAYHCDKLECDLQAKLYDEQGCVDVNDQPNNEQLNSEDVSNLIKNGVKSFSDIWITLDEKLFKNDDNFMSVLQYAKNNEISKNIV